MKKSTVQSIIIVLLALSFCFVSCGTRHSVQLNNGSEVTVNDQNDLYKSGDKVCVYRGSSNVWTLDEFGHMQDTVEYRTGVIGGDTIGVVIEYRIGKVQ